MAQKKRPGAGEAAPFVPAFTPVPVRARRDGWTSERQVAFIRALAESGCVRDSCRRVGMSPETAYALARRPDAQSFRLAWDMAMDQAVRRIADEALSRCIHGVAMPHYYRGELVGEHRRYDERLTMFILGRRDPGRFGKAREEAEEERHPEELALGFGDALDWLEQDARREAAGHPRMVVRDFSREGEGTDHLPSLDDFSELEGLDDEDFDDALADLDEEDPADPDEAAESPPGEGDVASGSSGSAEGEPPR